MFKEFLSDLLKYLPGKILPGVFGLFLLPIMTRLLRPSDYGVYVIVTSTVSLLTIMGTEWIGPSLTRFLPEYEQKGMLKSFGETVLWLSVASIGSTALVAAVSLAVTPGFFGSKLIYGWLGVALFGAGGVFTIMMGMLVARRRPTAYSVFSIWQQCGCVTVGLLVAWAFSLRVEGLLLGSAAAVLVALPLLARSAFGGILGGGFSRQAAVAIASYGCPLMATNLAGWVLRLSDRYILQFFCGEKEVGLYAVSYNIADRSIYLVVSLVVLSSAPIVMQIWERQGAEPTRQFVSKLTRYYLLVAVPATVGLSLVGKSVVALLTTKEFHAGCRIMPLVAFSMFLMGIQRNYQLGLLFHKKTGVVLCILVLVSLFNVAFNLCLVPHFGFVGAGYSGAASYLVFTLAMAHVSQKYFAWAFPWKTLFRSTLAAAIMGVAVLAGLHAPRVSTVVSLTLAILLGVVTYAISIVAVGGVSRSELKLFARGAELGWRGRG